MTNAGVPASLPSGEGDAGLFLVDDGDVADVARTFIAAIAKHRHYDRDAVAAAPKNPQRRPTS